MKMAAKAALVVSAGILGVGLGLVIALSPARPPHSPPTPFRFVGTPGLTAGFVTFQVTNEERIVVLCGVLPPQVKSNGQWIGVQVPTARTLTLAPRQTSTLITVPPSSSLPWRVPVAWSYAPTRLQIWKTRAENFLRRQNRGLGLESHVAYSPEITP
jgi:hypothetical protein